MIEVHNLRKVFGEFEAIKGISFSVERGEVVGFLGPNGAGKTTTLRILTGFIPATSGTATVAGFNVFDDSMEARKRLGYLPENVPLYAEMRVEEYLRYRGALKKIPRFERYAHIERVIEQCWLEDVRRRIIGHLSKGYRQRVGLADALLGAPEVLILDEPTVGLDPNQVRETRMLIKSLAESHTVILSTHILHEVEMICNRVIIIRRGEIVADDTQQGLIESMSESSKLFIELKGEGAALVDTYLRSVQGIGKFYIAGSDDIIRIELDQQPGFDLRQQLSTAFSEQGFIILELRSERFMLEDIFVGLTSDKFTESEPPSEPAEVEQEIESEQDVPAQQPDIPIAENASDEEQSGSEMLRRFEELKSESGEEDGPEGLSDIPAEKGGR